MKPGNLVLTALASLVLLLQGCGLKPQYLHLDPRVAAPTEAVADGTLIGLGINDTRGSKKLGEVGDPLTQMVDVSLTEDFRPNLYASVSKALTGMGFDVVPYSDAMMRWIQIDIRNLELRSEKAAFNFQTELQANVAVRARSENRTYDRAFFVRKHKVTATPPYQRHSNELVNSAVAQAIEDALADRSLLDMLAQ
jgi:uncharacterized lipoprotein YajG